MKKIFAVMVVVFVPYVSYANLAPVVDSINTQPSSTVAPGTRVIIEINAHDPDCTGTCQPGGGLTSCGTYIRADLLSWSATGGIIENVYSSPSSSPFYTRAEWVAPLSAGTYTINVFLADSGGMLCGGRQSTTVQIPISVVVGTPPSIRAILTQPPAVSPGEKVRITVLASDDKDSPGQLTYIFTASGGTFDPPDSRKPWERLWNAPPVQGAYQVRVEVRDSDGNSSLITSTIRVRILYSAGEINGKRKIWQPADVAVFDDGSLVAVDSYSSALLLLTPSGEEKRRIYLSGVVAADAGEGKVIWAVTRNGCLLSISSSGSVISSNCDFLSSPSDVKYVESLSRVYVADSGSVKIFTAGCAYAGEITGLKSPAGIDYLPLSDKLVITDAGAAKVYVYAADGTLLTSWGVQGNATGEFMRPHGVSHDSSERIYVTDSYLDKIEIFDVSGVHLGTVGGHGVSKGRLLNPGDIEVDGYGRVFVASQGSGRIEVYSLCRGDSDCDGMDDVYEKKAGLNPLDPTDAFKDPDSDGLTNLKEFSIGTDPLNADTDGDGVNDGDELRNGMSPLSPYDNRPVAVASVSSDIVGPGEVFLDGSGSYDPNGDVITQYLWRQVDGPEAVITGSEQGKKVRVLVKKAGIYTFALKVSDGKAWSKEASVTIQVLNTHPGVYLPAFFMAHIGESIQMRPVVYDANGDDLRCTWQADDSAPLPGDAGTCWPFVTPESEGIYTYTLYVSDGQNEISRKVKLAVWSEDVKIPVIYPEVAFDGRRVNLEAMVYGDTELLDKVVWRVKKDNVFLYLEGENPHFEPWSSGIYTIEVSAAGGVVVEPQLYVNVCTGGKIPLIGLRDEAVWVGESVSVIPEVRPEGGYRFTWIQKEGPPILFDSTAEILKVTPVEGGLYAFELRVKDVKTGCEARASFNLLAMDEKGLPDVSPLYFTTTDTEIPLVFWGTRNDFVFIPGTPGLLLSNSTSRMPVALLSSRGLYALHARGVTKNRVGVKRTVYVISGGKNSLPVISVPEGVFADPHERVSISAGVENASTAEIIWDYTGGDLPEWWRASGSVLEVGTGKKGEEYYFTVRSADERVLPRTLWIAVVDVPIGAGRGENVQLSASLDDQFVKSAGVSLEVPYNEYVGAGMNVIDEFTREIVVAPSGVPLEGEVRVTFNGIPLGIKVEKVKEGGERVPVEDVRLEGSVVSFSIYSTGRYLLTFRDVKPDVRGVVKSRPRAGCVIAGVAHDFYGGDFLNALRWLRDSVIRNLPGGEDVVEGYYYVSHLVYPYVMKYSLLKWVLRVMLAPLYLIYRSGESILFLALAVGFMVVMRRKKIKKALTGALIIGSSVLFAMDALALDPPHDVLNCSDCHTLHNAPGLTLTSSWGNWYLCMSCHSPGNMAAAKPFSMNFRAIPGQHGSSHSWDVSVNNPTYDSSTPVSTEMNLRLDSGKIMCSTCHDQHSQADQPFDPSAPPAPQAGRHFQRISNDQNQMCLDCHSARHITDVRTYTGSALSHPVGVPYDPSSTTNLRSVPLDVNGAPQSGARFEVDGTGDTNPTNNLTLDSTGNVNCMSCHGVHYTDGNIYTVDRP